MAHIWKPHFTVAAIAERDGRFLCIEEHAEDGVRINQPAGHVEAGESPLNAVVRETLEESAWQFTPQALVGIYQWTVPDGSKTYVRLAFCGQVDGFDAARTLDHGIIRSMWLTRDELHKRRASHRSPLVLDCVDDYLAGHRLPLNVIRYYPS